MKDSLNQDNKNPASFIGLEINLDAEKTASRGWVQEVSPDGQGLVVGLYPDGKEVNIALSDISREPLLKTPLPVLDGFVAIDFVAKDNTPVASIRIPESEYETLCSAAKALDQDFESFLLDCLVSGAKKELEQ
jgi:hypothetical protein